MCIYIVNWILVSLVNGCAFVKLLLCKQLSVCVYVCGGGGGGGRGQQITPGGYPR